MTGPLVVPLKTAVERHVADGDVVFVGGFGHCVPFAATHELIRQRRRDLTICRSGADIAIDQLIGAHCVARLVFGYIGNPGIGLAHAFSRAVASAEIALEEWTNFAMVLRLHAAAIGVPFLPTRILLTGDIGHASIRLQTVRCPFTHEELVALPALRPDVALVHAQRASTAGDVQLWGVDGDTVVGAMASDRIVVTVEEIVEPEVVAVCPERTVIPAYRVSAICRAPLGAHPSYVQDYYGRDDEAYLEYDRIARDESDLEEYLQRRIRDLRDRDAYADAWVDPKRATLSPA